MKYIRKNPEPVSFTEWKMQANDNWQPHYAEMPGNIKEVIREALLKEQGWICCYCESRISNDTNEEDGHVEHFIPQSRCANKALAYENMLYSCQNVLEKGKPRHCGHLKGDRFPTGMISPQDPACERRFSYTGNGQILPASDTDTDAKDTIQCLGLDIPKLQALRSKAIDPFLEPTLTPDEVLTFAHRYLQKDLDGRYQPFWTSIAYLFSLRSEDGI